MPVPIYSTITGHKRLRFWAAASNSAFPKLRFFETEVEFQVMRKHRRAWSDVELVDAQSGWTAHYLTLDFQGTSWNFTANIIRRDWLVMSLGFLARQGLALSPRAQDILKGE